jgi:hypothetical protein
MVCCIDSLVFGNGPSVHSAVAIAADVDDKASTIMFAHFANNNNDQVLHGIG